jgi:hypothetical protein
MLTASIRRTAVLVSLVAALATPWASAAGPGAGGLRPAHAAESATPDFLDLVFHFFRTAKTPGLKAGCKLDPDGRCNASMAQPPSTKAGCHLDPNGRCLQ